QLASNTLTGTVATASNTTLTGTSTIFTRQLGIGDRITVGSDTRTITAIASDTSLTVSAAFSGTASGQSATALHALMRLDSSSTTSSTTAKLMFTDNYLLTFGVLAATVAGMKGSGTTVAFRLGDDSADAPISAAAAALSGNLTLADAVNIVLNTTTGTKIGTATTQKLGFFNATPVVQPSSLTSADASTVDGTYSAEEQAVIGNLRT